MADNTTINTGTGGDVIRDKDRSGVKTQIVGLDLGIGGGTESLMNGALADTVSTATITQVASSASSVTLQASNASRKGLHIFNDSTAALFVKYGTTASSTSFVVKLAAGAFWEMPTRPIYTGRVDGIWASANGNAYVTEL